VIYKGKILFGSHNLGNNLGLFKDISCKAKFVIVSKKKATAVIRKQIEFKGNICLLRVDKYLKQVLMQAKNSKAKLW
jgi:hypothetical protein